MKTIAVLLVILAAGVAWCGEDLKRFDISTTTAIPVPSDLTYGPSSSFAADSKNYILLPAPMDQAEVDALLKEMEKDAGATFKHSPIDEIVFTDPHRAGGGVTLEDLLKAIEYGLEAMGHDPGVSPELTHGHSDLLYRPLPSEIDTLRARLKDLEERSRRIKFMREAADKLRKAIKEEK